MKKRKDGLYQKKIVVNGKTKHIYGKTQKEITEKIMNLQNCEERNAHNFLHLAEELLKKRQDIIGFKALECYQGALKKLQPLYKMSIEDITLNDIQSIINNCYAYGYSKSTISKVKILYGLVCDYAVSKNISVVNYSKLAKIPKGATVNKRHGISDEEIRIIENSLDIDFGLYAYMMLYTGMRRGEMLALMWEDIDIKKRIISINKSVEFIQNQPNIKQPKTQSGIRTVPILESLVPHLHNFNCTGFVFGDGKTPLTKTMITKKWAKYCKTTGLSCTQHQLRHTYATILYRAGVDPKTAQILLGHADISTTMNIYTDTSNDMQEKASAKLNKFVSSF